MTPLRELELWWCEHGKSGLDELWDIVGRIIANERDQCAKIAERIATEIRMPEDSQ